MIVDYSVMNIYCLILLSLEETLSEYFEQFPLYLRCQKLNSSHVNYIVLV